VLAIVVRAQFMFAVDAFIVNVAVPSIQADLRSSAAEIAAMIAVYQIAFATMVITGGRLGGIFGRGVGFFRGDVCGKVAPGGKVSGQRRGGVVRSARRYPRGRSCAAIRGCSP
jgi:MFS family permease